MTITKNDFFTAYNFKTLQDIGKEYEWEDFFKSITEQFTKQFNVTWSKDNKIKILRGSIIKNNKNYKDTNDLQEDKLYIVRMQVFRPVSALPYSKHTYYDTGVYVGESSKFSSDGSYTQVVGNQARNVEVIIPQDDTEYNVGDVFIDFDRYVTPEGGGATRPDYNGAVYEVYKIKDGKIHLMTMTKYLEGGALGQLYLYKKK